MYTVLPSNLSTGNAIPFCRTAGRTSIRRTVPCAWSGIAAKPPSRRQSPAPASDSAPVFLLGRRCSRHAKRPCIPCDTRPFPCFTGICPLFSGTGPLFCPQRECADGTADRARCPAAMPEAERAADSKKPGPLPRKRPRMMHGISSFTWQSGKRSSWTEDNRPSCFRSGWHTLPAPSDLRRSSGCNSARCGLQSRPHSGIRNHRKC